jgi:hypothetical protein
MVYVGTAEKPLSVSISINNSCVMHYLCTHLNLFSSKGPHPNRNSEQGLIEKASVAFFFLSWVDANISTSKPMIGN